VSKVCSIVSTYILSGRCVVLYKILEVEKFWRIFYFLDSIRAIRLRRVSLLTLPPDASSGFNFLSYGTFSWRLRYSLSVNVSSIGFVYYYVSISPKFESQWNQIFQWAGPFGQKETTWDHSTTQVSSKEMIILGEFLLVSHDRFGASQSPRFIDISCH
jgi:hypothetical protein